MLNFGHVHSRVSSEYDSSWIEGNLKHSVEGNITCTQRVQTSSENVHVLFLVIRTVTPNSNRLFLVPRSTPKKISSKILLKFQDPDRDPHPGTVDPYRQADRYQNLIKN